jgi:acetylglutamate kinase
MSTTVSMRVLKVGGRAQEDPALVGEIAAAWRAAPGALCVVHGGAVEIDRLQRALGATPRFVGGRRVTSAEDIDTVRMALSGSANISSFFGDAPAPVTPLAAVAEMVAPGAIRPRLRSGASASSTAVG